MVGNSLAGGSVELTVSSARQSLWRSRQNPSLLPGPTLILSCEGSLRNKRPRGGAATAAQQEDLIKHIFRELQDLGLVRPGERLVSLGGESTNVHPDFCAGKIHYRTVYYRLGNGSFDSDGLRFILLHEQRHLTGFRDWFAYLSIGIAWVAIFAYLQSVVHLLPQWSSLLALPATWYCSMPFLRWGETRSDLWAALQLKEKFGIGRPSIVAFKALEWPPIPMNRSRKIIRFLALRVFHTNYYPSVEKRVERIAKEVDEHPGNQP